MIKLFATDLDETLLVNGRVPKENIQALQRMEEAGVKLCFISGRSISSVRYLIDRAGIHAAAIGSNGSLVQDETGKVLLQKEISQSLMEKILDLSNQYKVYFHFYDRSGAFVTPRLLNDRFSHLRIEEDERGTLYQCSVICDPFLSDHWDRYHSVKVQYTVTPEKGKLIERELRKLPGLSVTYSGAIYLEAMEESVTKWSALHFYASQLGIRDSEIMACGDYLNDLEMVREAGYGVAVGNSLPDLKEAAFYVTGPCNEFGIAQAAEEFFQRGYFV